MKHVSLKRTLSALLAGLLLLFEGACIRVPLPRQAEAPREISAADTAAWNQADLDFFREYITGDISTLHQLIKDPAAFGIYYADVERTLGTYAQAEEADWYAFVEDMLSRLNEIDRNGLSDRDQLAYDTLLQYLRFEQEGENYYGYFEPLLPYTGIQADLPIVFWFYELRCEQDVEDYLTLMADTPRFFSELLAYEEYRAKELNIFMVEANLNKVLEDIDSTIAAGEDIFLVDTFQEALQGVPGLTQAQRTAYEQRHEALLKNQFHQAYVDLRAGLEALRPYCREAVGVASLGNDTYTDWFVFQLKQSCAEDEDPEFLADILYEGAMKNLRLAVRAIQAGGQDLEQVTMGTVEENVSYLRELLDPLLSELPEVNVRYEQVPEAFREVMSPAFYLVPAFDDWQNNTIALNGPEEARNLLSTLAHEGFDGHLYQYVYHRSQGFSLSEQLLEETAYAEAWSQYSERLLAEHIDKKYRKTDLQLDHYFQQAITCLIGYCSIRVNLYKDSFEDAYDIFQSFFTYTEEEFRELIYEPYIIGSPFYYMPYAYGYARLMDLHDGWKAARGRSFLEKDFHSAYLSLGPSYFNLLADRLEK